MKNFKQVQLYQALCFLLIPFILWAVLGVRLKSISEYANYTPLPFALSLTLAGSLFINDGIITKKRWYNYIIGFALFGVVLFKNTSYPVVHYSFASIFFLGSLFNMVFFSSNKERLIKVLVAILVLIGMCGTFIFNWYSIFWAEFFGMIPISLHYILESLNKID